MAIRILVTGSRNFPDYLEVVRGISLAIETVVAEKPDEREIVIIEGGAKGADAMAKRFVNQAQDFFHGKGVALRLETHRADWSNGPSAGPARNQAMVDSGADICVAFLFPGVKGTLDCINRATKAGIPVVTYGKR